jgi:HD-GYP domain-containing protein (c-di-GMP phosphodiesterase class II)
MKLEAPVISLETRIITVCDIYDALTADRPYRKAMSRERALEIMTGDVGKAIDADCLAALRAVVESETAAGPMPVLSPALAGG